MVRHPAKYTDTIIPILFGELEGTKNVLDPFAGTGKIGMIKTMGYEGEIHINDIEPEWIYPNEYGCDVVRCEDAETLKYPSQYFDAIATSPTYGNRMADHHNAKDGSQRMTYTHCMGHDLKAGNTGVMQFGKTYCDKHSAIYSHLKDLLKPDGKLIINMSNHIRKGKEVDVCGWTKAELTKLGFEYVREHVVKTPRMRYGKNANLRVNNEVVMVFVKKGEN